MCVTGRSRVHTRPSVVDAARKNSAAAAAPSRVSPAVCRRTIRTRRRAYFTRFDAVVDSKKRVENEKMDIYPMNERKMNRKKK